MRLPIRRRPSTRFPAASVMGLVRSASLLLALHGITQLSHHLHGEPRSRRRDRSNRPVSRDAFDCGRRGRPGVEVGNGRHDRGDPDPRVDAQESAAGLVDCGLRRGRRGGRIVENDVARLRSRLYPRRRRCERRARASNRHYTEEDQSLHDFPFPSCPGWIRAAAIIDSPVPGEGCRRRHASHAASPVRVRRHA